MAESASAGQQQEQQTVRRGMRSGMERRSPPTRQPARPAAGSGAIVTRYLRTLLSPRNAPCPARTVKAPAPPGPCLAATACGEVGQLSASLSSHALAQLSQRVKMQQRCSR